MRRPGERGAGGLGLGEHRIHVLLGGDELPDAELAGLRWPKRYPRVLRQLGARVQSKYEVSLEVEHRNVAGWALTVAGEVGPGDSCRVQTEALAVERERAVEIRHSERDHMDARFHGPQSAASALQAVVCPSSADALGLRPSNDEPPFERFEALAISISARTPHPHK